MSKRLLVLIDSSYGELEWILPVLKYIKKNHKDINISILFNSIKSEEILKDNSFLKEIIPACADQIYDFGSFLPFKKYTKLLFELMDKKAKNKSSIIKDNVSRIKSLTKIIFAEKIVRKINPSVVLKDASPDNLIRKKIMQTAKNIGSKIIMYPHAAELHKYNALSRPELTADAFLCNTSWMKNIFLDKEKCFVTGIPRFDAWWIEFLKNQCKEYLRNIDIADKSKIFLLFTACPTPKLFSQDTRRKLVRDVVEFVLSNKKSFLVIKPHPRDSLEEINKLIDHYDNKKIVIDNSSPMCLSTIADVIITIGHSSVILDSLSVDKTVLEYKNKMKMKDAYGDMGLIPSTEDLNTLKTWIGQTISAPEKMKKKYTKEFRKIIPKTYNESTKKATNVILNMLQK